MSDVIIRRARHGRGLFSRRRLRAGQSIIHIAGRIVHYEVLWERGGSFLANCIRFGPETYLDPGDGPGRYLNHSCEPNTAIRKVRNQLHLFATRAIVANEELVFDYSTTIGDDDIWTMRCHCGTPSCRRRVARFSTLPESTRDAYVAAGMVPGFILRTLGR